MQPFTSLQNNQTHPMSSLGEELETLSTNQILNYIIHDTFNASPATLISPPNKSETLPLKNKNAPPTERKRNRRRRVKVCKNKEEAETQRMTHIAVERNRRKLMNEHLSLLKSLMPESYINRGDQASIVGGAIEYVKELEHLLQTLEAQKLLLGTTLTTSSSSGNLLSQPFSQFFSYPQYTWTTVNNTINNDNNHITNNIAINNNNNKYMDSSSLSRKSDGGLNDVADIEVSLTETHANVRILSRRSFSQLSKLVAAFHSLSLNILHLNVTTLDHLVLYSISAKVEEGCQLTCADDIAGAVHHMLKIIEQEVALCSLPKTPLL